MIESVQEIVSKMNKAERGLLPISIGFIDDQETESDLQVTRCDGTSGTGFHLQIPGRITISQMNLGIVGPELGGFKVTLMRNGNHLVQVPSCGSTENVSISHDCSFLKLMCSDSAAGAGKSVIWYDNLPIAGICKLMLLASSAIIEDIRTLQKSGLGSLAFFYCDFRDDQKKDQRGLLSSLLVQLC
jgi:hypothetical protein